MLGNFHGSAELIIDLPKKFPAQIITQMGDVLHASLMRIILSATTAGEKLP
jgi:hypothetical protein